MSFTTPCFIRVNTPELRRKLEELGHNICPCASFKDWDWLDCSPEYRVHGIAKTDEFCEDNHGRFLMENQKRGNPMIDCGTNEQLFLSLAALRDDSDEMQWFTDGYHWGQCQEVKACIFSWEQRYRTTPHKATPEELIGHFKTE